MLTWQGGREGGRGGGIKGGRRDGGGEGEREVALKISLYSHTLHGLILGVGLWAILK